jgi:hypothetical protein
MDNKIAGSKIVKVVRMPDGGYMSHRGPNAPTVTNPLEAISRSSLLLETDLGLTGAGGELVYMLVTATEITEAEADRLIAEKVEHAERLALLQGAGPSEHKH